MTERPSPSWRLRSLAAVVAAVVAMAGVGVAVAGQGGAPEPLAPLAEAAPQETLPVTVSDPEPFEVGPSVVAEDEGLPPEAAAAPLDAQQRGEEARAAAPDQDAVPAPSLMSQGSESSVATTDTTIDVSQIFGERAGSPEDHGVDGEGLGAELEAEVRVCVATLLDGIRSSFDGQPDAERIQAIASEVVDDALACVAGLVDVGQVLSCVGAVIQEILDVVMAMEFGDLPQLISEFADDMVRCVSG